MRRVTAAAAVTAAAIALAVTGCGSSGPHADPAACKAAMTSNYRYALAHPAAAPATEPPACKGIPAATLNKYAAEIIAQG